MKFLEKLEKLKQRGYYSVQVFYGEDIGCDDSDVAALDRNMKVFMVPVGCLGKVRVIYSGEVKDFLKFDFSQLPRLLSNPLSEDDMQQIEDGGWFTWGIDISMKNIKDIMPFSTEYF